MVPTERVVKATSYTLLTVLIILIMVVAEKILIPLTWSIVFSFLLLPFCKKLESLKIPRSAAAIISTIVFIVVSNLILFFLIYESAHILKNQDLLRLWSKEELSSIIDNLQSSLGLEVVDTSTVFSKDSMKNLFSLLAKQVEGIGDNTLILTLIPMYIFFFLNYRGLLQKFIMNFYSGDHRTRIQYSVKGSHNSIAQYLTGMAILTGVTIILTYLILLVFGIRYAFFFGVFLGILNLIPYIGNLLGFVVILLFIWGTKEPAYLLYVGISLYLSNLIQENFLRPVLVGDKMEMNAAVVFTAVIIGGMIWGFSGMVLFIPLVGVLKAFIDGNPEWKDFGIFFQTK